MFAISNFADALMTFLMCSDASEVEPYLAHVRNLELCGYSDDFSQNISMQFQFQG